MLMKSLPVIVMGITSILIQITALRQLFSVFSGNELDIGITLSVWLTAVGIGSYAGHRLRFRHALPISFLAVGLLSQPTILSINLIRPFLSMEFGETISLSKTIILTIFSLLPLCLVIGLQFPLAVSHLEGNAAKAYGLEAAGSFAAGSLFVLLLSGRVDAYTLSMAAGIINLIVALLLLRKKYLVAILLVPIFFYLGSDRINEAYRWKGAELIERIESRYGEIEVLKTKNQLNVYSSGKYLFSYPDRQVEELRSHLPMALQASASDILVIGGSASALREFLKYPINSVDFLEIDPEIINVSLRLLDGEDRKILSDRRLRIITTDARKFIKKLNAPRYDLIVLNLGEPSTANTNRFYTIEFFREAKTVLKKDGSVILSLPASFGYVGKRMQMANGSVYNSLKTIFRNVEVSSEEYGIISGSEGMIDTNPKTLDERFSGRAIKTEYFHPYLLHDAFSELKAGMVRERLEKITTINDDARPVAYLYNLMLWAEAQGSTIFMSVLDHKKELLASVIALLLVAAFLLRRKKEAAYFSIFSAGYSSMAFSTIIILAYQASFGYVYEMIGLITAVFMLGIAAGSRTSRTIKKPLSWIKASEALTIILIVSAPLFFKLEFSFYVLSLLGGLIAGIEFSAANRFMEEQDRVMVAGRFYAFDLAGSFLGAFTCSIFLVPLFGIQNTIFFVVLIKVISIILLFSIRDEKS